MLEDKDRIFKNLYNDLGADIDSAKNRGDWSNTKEICSKGRDWIIEEVKKKKSWKIFYTNLYNNTMHDKRSVYSC